MSLSQLATLLNLSIDEEEKYVTVLGQDSTNDGCTDCSRYIECGQLQLVGIVLYIVDSCLVTKVFVGNLQATGRGWVIIK